MYKKTTYLLFLTFILNIEAQTVTTVDEGSFSDALAIDSQGVVYGSDWSGTKVYKYDLDGSVSVFKGGFTNPNGIGINALDEIYICDHTANEIQKYDTSGNLLTMYDTNLTTPAGIKPIPNTTDMLIVEYGVWNWTTGQIIYSSKIKKLEADGTITILFDGTPLNGPAGITFVNDIPYIANFNDRKIFKFENNVLTEIAQLPATAQGSNFIGFLTSLGNQLYATQIGENKIYRINSVDGSVTLYAGSNAGGNDGEISNATFSGPNGILADPINNRIYISDSATKNLRIINGVGLSVDEFNLSKFEIKLFPNPAFDSLNIKLSKLKDREVSISIFDILGKEIFKKDFGVENFALDTQINIEKFPSGTYNVRVKTKTEVVSKKVIF
jgi:sugar lactone lactonase YvrE